MLRPEARLLLALLAILTTLSGCNRLTFVRPSFERKGFDQVAHEVHVSDSGRKNAPDTRGRLMLAQQRLAAGDVVGAQREANAALKLDPKSVDAHTLLAAALGRGGNAAAAGEHYRRAAELAPASGPVLNNYGVWLCSQAHAGESLPWFDRAVSSPGYASPATALANAGVCAAQAGQGDRADRDLRRAIALDPVNATALGALAEREFQAGRAFEARAFSERRLAAAPADPQALMLASQIEEKLGDRSAAARYVQRLRAEFPDAQDARNSGTGDGGKR
ncbi:MAG TPA: type IV pilus biogenesis/stability protein PilW [Lysobacter sp.]